MFEVNELELFYEAEEENERAIAVYKKCYCNIPKKVENMNKKYCECSAGWYMRLFSEVFEKSVTVTIVDTIVNGAAECVFEISDYV